jgi:aminocarboxymuconate-semialdehyde decarboxylase
LAAKYGDDRFPVIHHGDDGRHRIYKDGKFFREIWPKTWDRRNASPTTRASACRCR